LLIGCDPVAFNTPARERHNFGGYRLALRSFLEIADAIERTLVDVPGVHAAGQSAAPLRGDRPVIGD
jgi:hypothetical protein